jgi:hypothetical protein
MALVDDYPIQLLTADEAMGVLEKAFRACGLG